MTMLYEKPELDPAALFGLAGQIVTTLEPHSESDPVALLAQLLVAFGNCIGRPAHFYIEGDRHQGNLFAVIVGDSSVGRKGTSWGRVRQLFVDVDDTGWLKNRVSPSSLSSGEGLIAAVCDELTVTDKKTQEDVVIRKGTTDKRLLCVESEFGRLLAVKGRQGNTLSTIVREAWDGNDLGIKLKDAITATEPHISIIGHITAHELLGSLSRTDMFNGFCNRFLWLLSGSSKDLPWGGNIPADHLGELRHSLRLAVQFAQQQGEIGVAPCAVEVWEAEYHHLKYPSEGQATSLLSRGAPQVRRLAMLHALMNCSALVRAEHLEAALALYQYSKGTVEALFGRSTGNRIADKILDDLTEHLAEGLSREYLRRTTLGGHVFSADLTATLKWLEDKSEIRFASKWVNGKKAEWWYRVVN